MRLNAFDAGWPGVVGRLGLLLVLLVVAGCGSGQGKVSGRVLFQGEPPDGLTTSDGERSASPGFPAAHLLTDLNTDKKEF
jgi:hypothetical protein